MASGDVVYEDDAACRRVLISDGQLPDSGGELKWGVVLEASDETSSTLIELQGFYSGTNPFPETANGGAPLYHVKITEV